MVELVVTPDFDSGAHMWRVGSRPTCASNEGKLMQITKIEIIGVLPGTDRVITHYQSAPLGISLADHDAIVGSFASVYEICELKVTWSVISD